MLLWAYVWVMMRTSCYITKLALLLFSPYSEKPVAVIHLMAVLMMISSPCFKHVLAALHVGVFQCMALQCRTRVQQNYSSSFIHSLHTCEAKHVVYTIHTIHCCARQSVLYLYCSSHCSHLQRTWPCIPPSTSPFVQATSLCRSY